MLLAAVRLLFAITLSVACAQASMPIWTGVEINSFAQAADRPEVIYAADRYSLFRSADHGRSWAPLPIATRERNYGFLEVSVVPENHRHLVVTGMSEQGWTKPGYHESRDGGQTWRWRSLDAVIGEQLVRRMALKLDTAAEGGTWWLVLSQGLWRSIDQGESWEWSALEASEPTMVHGAQALFRLSANKLFASVDQGVTWTLRHTFPELDRDIHQTLLALPNGELWAMQNYVWYVSRDQGNTFVADQTRFGTQRQFSPGFFGTRCSILQNKQVPSSLKAFCRAFSVTSHRLICMQSSDDQGKTWTVPAPRKAKGELIARVGCLSRGLQMPVYGMYATPTSCGWQEGLGSTGRTMAAKTGWR